MALTVKTPSASSSGWSSWWRSAQMPSSRSTLTRATDGGEALDLSAELPTVLAVMIEGRRLRVLLRLREPKVLAYWGILGVGGRGSCEVTNATT